MQIEYESCVMYVSLQEYFQKKEDNFLKWKY